jgi:23S rRNA G2445 N2-methylase RlmL
MVLFMPNPTANLPSRVPIDPTKRATTRVTCAQHTAPILRAEIEALGHTVQDEHATGIDLGATLPEAMALALRLRTATHVMWQLARFRCPSPKALYKEIASIAWEEIIPPDGYLTIRAAADTPTIDNQMYPALVTKDAICDRMVKKTGRRPDAGPDRSGVCLNLYWKDDRAQVFLNLNGSSLSNRGYRRIPHQAPMRETLAAAVLSAAGYDGTTPLVNPMCGSGTLAIEGALIAAGRAPGLLRSDYAILKTALPIRDLWDAARAEAKGMPRAEVPLIVASDRDPVAVDAARKNAQVAGVDHLISFEVCDFIDTELPDDPGHIVLNPEYGERMGDMEELGDTYADIGDFFKQHAAGWTGHVFTGSPELAKKIGLRADRRQPFFNGSIECRLLSYQIYAGSRAGADAMD